MKDAHDLHLIYSLKNVTDPDSVEPNGTYEVLYFFSATGTVPLDMMREVSQETFQRELATPIVLHSLDELKKFALGVCQRLRAPEVFILSVQDYNIGIEAARDVRAFRELFRRYGVNIHNPDIIQKGPPGFIGRLFKK